MTAAFLTPFFLHAVLIAGLYLALTWERTAAVRGGRASYADFVRADGDPKRAARIQRNLANQFELPALVWFAVLLLLWSEGVTPFDVVAAWVFFAGRVAHTLVQTLTDNVRLRGLVFTINFLGAAALLAHAGWVVLRGG